MDVNFTRSPLQEFEPQISNYIKTREIRVIDPKQVARFQDDEVDREINLRHLRWIKNHQFMYFCATRHRTIGIISWILVILCLVVGSVLAEKVNYMVSGVALVLTGLAIAVMSVVAVRWNLVLNSKTPWLESPWNHFQDEYSAEKALNFVPSNIQELLRLKVEHHPASEYRFLVLYNVLDDSSPQHYVDYWQKPGVGEPEAAPAPLS